MKPKQAAVTVKLVYPAYRCDRPHVAEAMVRARLTPKQVIVDTAKQPQIILVNGATSGPSWIGPHKYWRKHGHCVGWYPSQRTWQLAPCELERLNSDVAKREMNQ